jgi:hypothetical protein
VRHNELLEPGAARGTRLAPFVKNEDEPDGKTCGMGGVSQRGIFAATATLAGASCYALHLALAGLGLAENSIANMEALVDRPLMAVVAIDVLLVGWVVALRQRPSPRVLMILGVITALAGAAITMALCQR